MLVKNITIMAIDMGCNFLYFENQKKPHKNIDALGQVTQNLIQINIMTRKTVCCKHKHNILSELTANIRKFFSHLTSNCFNVIFKLTLKYLGSFFNLWSFL